jgi:hypothetical protein
MTKRISVEELLATVPPGRVNAMLKAAAPDGLTAFDMVGTVFPDLDDREHCRLAQILQAVIEEVIEGYVEGDHTVERVPSLH